MRAAAIETTGPVENIRVVDLPRPVPAPTEVLVKVGAAGVNPIDLYVRSGLVAMPMAFPYVIGCDLAGTVEAVGRSAARFKPGDRVWATNQGLVGRPGVTAEYAAIDEAWLVPTPDRLSDVEAAAIALTGVTAHLGLFAKGRLAEGDAVYVPGGTGGVGSMVVQLAKAAGARVATSAGSVEKVRTCLELGADFAWNYKTDDLPGEIRSAFPEGVDVWYETRREPDLEVSIPLLRKGGRMILMAGRAARPPLPLGAFYPRDCSLFGFAVFNATPEDVQQAGEDIDRHVEAGRVKALVGRVFPLDQAAEAHRFLEANTIQGAGTLQGKVVIQVA